MKVYIFYVDGYTVHRELVRMIGWHVDDDGLTTPITTVGVLDYLEPGTGWAVLFPDGTIDAPGYGEFVSPGRLDAAILTEHYSRKSPN
ncbi:hypothetical protein [Inquilinus sp. OTU3971]|uniref:hypothetical protein n=1 Tax=Inquilinus sp. OTU3971 TaxID=3043855 RepID=UPI00313A77BB